MSSGWSIVGSDDKFREYMAAQGKINSMIQAAHKEVKELSSESKEKDLFNQEVNTQMYLIEIMIENIGREIHAGLDGKYRDAVLDQMLLARKHIKEANNRWEDFRKSFK